MMDKIKNVSILDCTLRDGGYYTNWDFTDSIVDNYIKCMRPQSPISHVEIGYRSNPQKNYLGKYYYCPKFVLDNFRSQLPDKKLAIMLNEKDTKIKDLEYLLKPCIGNIDLIRMAVAPENLLRALMLAKEIKDYGFRIGFNLMYLSKWGKDKSFLKQLSKTNDIVDYLYLVDSYGGIAGKEVETIVQSVDKVTNSILGFHGHNNLELAFANTIIAIDAGCKMVDATILGMGRGAGNLKTELILTYLSSKYGVEVSFNELGSLVNNVYEISEFGKLLRKYNWGSNLAYMVSGANSLPQKEVMEWISERAYSINSIVQALNSNTKSGNNNSVFPKFNLLKNNKEKAIVIGGGPSAAEHSKAVNKLMNQNQDYCLIHASTKNAKYYKDINVPQFYCLVGNEGFRMEQVFKELELVKGKCILPPSPREMGTYIPIEMKKQTFELDKIDFTDKYKDSHFSIALQVALNMCAGGIYLLGFDGYSGDSEMGQKQIKLTRENEYLLEKIISTGIPIHSLTQTSYTNIKEISIYQLLG